MRWGILFTYDLAEEVQEGFTVAAGERGPEDEYTEVGSISQQLGIRRRDNTQVIEICVERNEIDDKIKMSGGDGNNGG